MQISIEDVMRAIRLKSFDYQVLNLLLYELEHKQVRARGGEREKKGRESALLDCV